MQSCCDNVTGRGLCRLGYMTIAARICCESCEGLFNILRQRMYVAFKDEKAACAELNLACPSLPKGLIRCMKNTWILYQLELARQRGMYDTLCRGPFGQVIYGDLNIDF
jgi:hypothetical protein